MLEEGGESFVCHGESCWRGCDPFIPLLLSQHVVKASFLMHVAMALRLAWTVYETRTVCLQLSESASLRNFDMTMSPNFIAAEQQNGIGWSIHCWLKHFGPGQRHNMKGQCLHLQTYQFVVTRWCWHQLWNLSFCNVPRFCQGAVSPPARRIPPVSCLVLWLVDEGYNTPVLLQMTWYGEFEVYPAQ